MGNYNSQYENYYNSLKKRSRADYSSFHRGNNFSNSRSNLKDKGNFLIRRITIDLIGVFVLFTMVILCKIIVTPQTKAVYNYSKNVVDANFDYKEVIYKGKNIDIKKAQGTIMEFIEKLQNKVTGNEMVKNKIKNNFAFPVDGIETSAFGQRTDPVTKELKIHQGVDVNVKENTEVKSSYDGKIKECGFNKDLGNYIIIDHGEGIETKYAHLNKILVKKEDAVKKSQVIAQSGNTGKSTGPHLHFEVLYMGENKNPEEFFFIPKNN